MIARAIVAPLLLATLVGTTDAAAAVRVTTSGKPRIARLAEEPVLLLPRAMQDALDRFDPGFAVWTRHDYCGPLTTSSVREAPFAVIGDFNGDHVLDVAVHGRSRSTNVIVAILSGEGRFEGLFVSPGGSPRKEDDGEWVNTTKVCEGLTTSLGLVRGPAHFEDPAPSDGEEDRRPPLDLRTDAFVVGFLEKGENLYYVEGGALRERALGC